VELVEPTKIKSSRRNTRNTCSGGIELKKISQFVWRCFTFHSSILHKMEDWKVKQLCDNIEKSCRPRDEINLATFCNKHPNIYGNKASDLRRAVQKKFDLIKRKTIQQYAHFLDSLEVSHGTATSRELRCAAFNQEPATLRELEPQVEVEAAEAESAMTEQESVTEESNSEELESAFGNLSIRKATAPPPPTATVKVTPSKRPPTFSLFSSPAAHTTMFSSPAGSMMSPDGNGSAFTPSTWNSNLGSKANPYQIHVDTKHPERNREFDVEFVAQIQHKNYTQSSFHIRTQMAVQDRESWEATVYTGDPNLENRAILIRAHLVPFGFLKPTDIMMS
jgi:hypothetical protein